MALAVVAVEGLYRGIRGLPLRFGLGSRRVAVVVPGHLVDEEEVLVAVVVVVEEGAAGAHRLGEELVAPHGIGVDEADAGFLGDIDILNVGERRRFGLGRPGRRLGFGDVRRVLGGPAALGRPEREKCRRRAGAGTVHRWASWPRSAVSVARVGGVQSGPCRGWMTIELAFWFAAGSRWRARLRAIPSAVSSGL